MDLYSIVTAVLAIVIILAGFIAGGFHVCSEIISLTKRFKMRSNGVRTRAAITRAAITSIWEKRKHKAPNKYGIYVAEVSFENEGGATISSCCTSRGTYLDKFQYGKGEELNIIYCKNNHHEFYLPSDKQELYWSIYCLAVGLILLSISSAFVWVMFRGVLLK